MLPYLLDGKKLDEAKASVHKRHERLLKNVTDIDASEIQETYLTSLTKMFDPHSSYFSADTLEDFRHPDAAGPRGHRCRTGATDDDGFCVVRKVVPEAPAGDLSTDRSRSNDKIIMVQQDDAEAVEVTGMESCAGSWPTSPRPQGLQGGAFNPASRQPEQRQDQAGHTGPR